MTMSCMKCGDIWMIETRQQTYLAEESLGNLLSGRAARQQNFHGLYSVRDRVTHLIDVAHASGAEGTDYLVIADLVSNNDGHAVLTIIAGSLASFGFELPMPGLFEARCE